MNLAPQPRATKLGELLINRWWELRAEVEVAGQAQRAATGTDSHEETDRKESGAALLAILIARKSSATSTRLPRWKLPCIGSEEGLQVVRDGAVLFRSHVVSHVPLEQTGK